MTSLIMVNAAGEFPPPMLIFKGIFKGTRLPPVKDLEVYDDNGQLIRYTVGKIYDFKLIYLLQPSFNTFNIFLYIL